MTITKSTALNLARFIILISFIMSAYNDRWQAAMWFVVGIAQGIGIAGIKSVHTRRTTAAPRISAHR